jgi:hypothetical protein
MMNRRNLFLLAVLALTSVLPACSTVSQIDFSPGLKSTLATLPKGSVVVIIDPAGKSTLADSEGKVAVPCKPPQHVMEGERQIAKTDKSTCAGLQKGYVVETINSEAVIRSFPNPHGCLYCYTRKTAGGYEQICRPNGCEFTGH